MHPTPARSPTANLDTDDPIAETRPTISCPGTTGYTEPRHSLRAVWRSLWHTPDHRISMTTSSARGARRLIGMATRGSVADGAPNAETVNVSAIAGRRDRLES
eukprot:Amastigsp_a174578_1363.p5 type:complete len:103 gc:universal Amastigsp_a174578_1363:820-1128(+)